MFEPFKTFGDDNYLVEIKRMDKVCFGSAQCRSTDPVGPKLAPHQRRVVNENYPDVAPWTYYNPDNTFIGKISKKIGSRRGIGFFASKSERFQTKFRRTPSPTRYELMPKMKRKRQIPAPFNSKDFPKFKTNDNPGPGTYHIAVTKCRRLNFASNFGRPKMIPCVETYCTPIPTDVCHKCNEICNNDYWHKDFNLFLCHLCWNEEKTTSEIYNMKELKEFKKIRNCSYVHSHEGTTVANRILPQKAVMKRQKLENYLDLYISCFS